MVPVFYHRNKKVALCMKADEAIRRILDVDSGWCSDPNIRTVATEWKDFLIGVEMFVDNNWVREWTREELKEVYNELESHNYHSFRKALIDVLKKKDFWLCKDCGAQLPDCVCGGR